MNKPILQYSDLVAVPVLDNGESLMDVASLIPEIVCEYQTRDMIHYVGNRFFLREGVMRRLRQACLELRQHHPMYRFKLVYAYRHPDIQRTYFEVQKERLRQQSPNATEDDLRDRTHFLIASPDVAGHPTGGAIDITIVDERGDELDMGTKIADFSQGEKIQTFFPALTSEQKKNRLLLRNILIENGFAPFDGEWWHFSYGDREWAKYYEKDQALYDQILPPS